MKTLADYLAPGLDIVSVGLNPSTNAVKAGYYFATPQNRFWRAFNASGLPAAPVEPGVGAMRLLLARDRIGFTDVVKRPSSSGSVLRAADFRADAPRLNEKLLGCAPRIVWFHGKVAWRQFLVHAGYATDPGDWGEQAVCIGQSRVFVSPNPSPANAQFSLAVITASYRALADLREGLVA
ncbi:MAG TPA: mismatch-specific DNA-glycosylase [Thioalkalivibrio sp.]|nr:mismatch-specific DNA-glycosylase [Thioalkalivibrio sp.]